MWLNINCTRLFSPNSITYSSSYLPPAKTKFPKVMFWQVSVYLRGGVSASGPGGVSDTPLADPLGQTPPGKTPPWVDTPWANTPLGRQPPLLPSACWDTHTPAQCMLGYIHPPLPSACWDTVNKRAVRIPLEYILVVNEQAWQWKQNDNMTTKCN